MKIRSIRCYHPVFKKSVTVDFIKNNDNLSGLFCIYGNKNSGKSLILRTLANRWSQHVLSNDDRDVKNTAIDIEFDLDRLGILSISRTHTPSVNRKRLQDHSKITESTVYGSILYYPIDRCFLTEESAFESGSAASGVFSIYSDVVTRKIQNSVILIDDIDFKMTQDEFSVFYRFLSDFLTNNSNQIIATVSDIDKIPTFDGNKRYPLNVDKDIIGDIIKGEMEIHGY